MKKRIMLKIIGKTNHVPYYELGKSIKKNVKKILLSHLMTDLALTDHLLDGYSFDYLFDTFTRGYSKAIFTG